MVIGGPEANVCRECLDRKLTNACPLSNPRISRQASLRYLCNYMKRWNTWPLTRFSLHVFSQLNWLATDIRKKKKSVKKIWKKSRVERGHDFSVTEEVVHSILWCTQSTYTQQWQTAAARNELKDCLYCSFCELFSSALFLSLLLGCCQTVPHAKFYSSR